MLKKNVIVLSLILLGTLMMSSCCQKVTHKIPTKPRIESFGHNASHIYMEVDDWQTILLYIHELRRNY